MKALKRYAFQEQIYLLYLHQSSPSSVVVVLKMALRTSDARVDQLDISYRHDLSCHNILCIVGHLHWLACIACLTNHTLLHTKLPTFGDRYGRFSTYQLITSWFVVTRVKPLGFCHPSGSAHVIVGHSSFDSLICSLSGK